MSKPPYRLVPYIFSSGTCFIQVPEEEWVKNWYEKARSEPDPPDFPFWARIWPSAFQMSRFLDKHPCLYENKRVLEIAAGLGLPSLMVAAKATSVVATDYLPEAVACLRASVSANGWQNMEAAIFNWHRGLPAWTADLVLLSDTNYSQEDLAAVEQLIRHYLQAGTMILITTPFRVVARDMLSSLQDYCRYRQVEETGDGIVTYLLSATPLSIPMKNYPF